MQHRTQTSLERVSNSVSYIARLYIWSPTGTTHFFHREHNELCFEGKQRIFTHDTCSSFGRCVAKNTCTQQNNLTFLQNCLGSDYSSIAEKERKKRYQLMKGWTLSTVLKARLRSTVTEERMLSLITDCSVIEGTLSGYLVLKAGRSGARLSSPERSRAAFISSTGQHSLPKAAKGSQGRLESSCASLPHLPLHFLLPSSPITQSELFSPPI